MLSFSNFSMEVPPRVKISVMDVPTLVPPISSKTSIRSCTPSKDPFFIPDALVLASAIFPMNSDILSPILTKLLLKPSPIPPIKLPIIFPMLPANCSNTGSPVSRNFWILGNSVIKAPIATAIAPIAPINRVRPAIAVTPIRANGPTNDIFTSKSVIIVMNISSSIVLAVAFSTQFISAKIPTKANNGTAIAVRANTPINAAGPAKPTNVNIPTITEHAPANTTNARALSIAFSIPLARARTPTKANNGMAIRVRANTPFKALPTLIPPAILRANDIAMINALKPSAASIPSLKSPNSIFFSASPSPLNIWTNKLSSASIKAGI